MGGVGGGRVDNFSGGIHQNFSIGITVHAGT